jgi:rare lipoprotein A
MDYRWGYWLMQLNNKVLLVGVALAIALEPAAAAIHLNPFRHKQKAEPTEAAPVAVDAPAVDPMQAQAPQPKAPDALTLYDDVGYAAVGISGGVSLVHATLPQPSFVEITNLNNGKTILAVVSAPMAVGRAIARLSPQAMMVLGGERGAALPVRIRRVNPPEQEQAALLAGRPASDRLDTPPVLLNALKRKLSGAQGKSGAAATDADFVPNEPAPRPVATRPTSVVKPEPRPARSTDNDSRFIVEGGEALPKRATPAVHRNAMATPKPSPAEGTEVSAPAPTGAFYIQVAAFSSDASAKSLAARLGRGASVQQAGQYWRVRMGPYASEEKAQAALGTLAAKGYRDVRLTH